MINAGVRMRNINNILEWIDDSLNAREQVESFDALALMLCEPRWRGNNEAKATRDYVMWRADEARKAVKADREWREAWAWEEELRDDEAF